MVCKGDALWLPVLLTYLIQIFVSCNYSILTSAVCASKTSHHLKFLSAELDSSIH